MRVLWLSAISCNGNAHALLNHSAFVKFAKDFEFIYHPVLETKYSLSQIVNETISCDVLLIEGAISQEFHRADREIKTIIHNYAKEVKHIVTVGTCASFGGIFKDSYPDASGLHFVADEQKEEFQEYMDKTISLSGCPLHPEILINCLYQLKEGMTIQKDRFLRPKEFFAYSVHNGCTRNEYFEYKIDTYEFGKLEGCMFYDHGCQAPFTSGVCNKLLWNSVNSKTRAGSPCFGCSEPSFPRQNLFVTQKTMGVPKLLPFGVPKRAYLSIAGVSKSFSIDRFQKGLFDD